MWWSRVSSCALSLILVLGAVGCGSSGFDGQSGSDALTMSFLGLNCAGELSFATISQSAADMAIRAFGYAS